MGLAAFGIALFDSANFQLVTKNEARWSPPGCKFSYTPRTQTERPRVENLAWNSYASNAACEQWNWCICKLSSPPPPMPPIVPPSPVMPPLPPRTPGVTYISTVEQLEAYFESDDSMTTSPSPPPWSMPSPPPPSSAPSPPYAPGENMPRIVVAAGTYVLTKKLKFPQTQLIIEAEVEGSVVLDGQYHLGTSLLEVGGASEYDSDGMSLAASWLILRGIVLRGGGFKSLMDASAGMSCMESMGCIKGGAIKVTTGKSKTAPTKLELYNCVIEDNIASYGGGIGIDGDYVDVTIDSSYIRRNQAYHGAGMYVQTYMGRTEVRNSEITHNTAKLEKGELTGGGLFVRGGTNTITSTVVRHNHANIGKQMQLISGVTYIGFPLKAGYWLQGANCLANRMGCGGGADNGMTQEEIAECERARDICARVSGSMENGWRPTVFLSYIFDDEESSTSSNTDYAMDMPAMDGPDKTEPATPPSLPPPSSPPAFPPPLPPMPQFTCMPATNIQNCDWMVEACENELPDCPLGKQILALPNAPLDDTLERPCPAGYVGSNLSIYQTSTTCGGACPKGFYCPDEPTLEPLPCPDGFYCEPGTVTPIPCPAGTHKNASLSVMVSVDDCVQCPVGTSCPVGAHSAQPCPPGEYNDKPEQAKCTKCEAGTFQNLAGQTACKACLAGCKLQPESEPAPAHCDSMCSSMSVCRRLSQPSQTSAVLARPPRSPVRAARVWTRRWRS